jgi:hypothetical protein
MWHIIYQSWLSVYVCVCVCVCMCMCVCVCMCVCIARVGRRRAPVGAAVSNGTRPTQSTVTAATISAVDGSRTNVPSHSSTAANSYLSRLDGPLHSTIRRGGPTSSSTSSSASSASSRPSGTAAGSRQDDHASHVDEHTIPGQASAKAQVRLECLCLCFSVFGWLVVLLLFCWRFFLLTCRGHRVHIQTEVSATKQLGTHMVFACFSDAHML